MAAMKMVGRSKRDKDVRPKGCVGVGCPLTEAEVRAQGHIERMGKGIEPTVEMEITRQDRSVWDKIK